MDFTYPNNIRFECNCCALCCGDTQVKQRCILLLESEAKKISADTKKEINEFAEEIEGKQPYRYVMRKTNGKCVFLKNNQCLIYSLRPLVCNFYPFQLTFNEDSGKYQFDFTLECPKIDFGAILTETYFSELFKLAKERLNIETLT